MMHTVRSMSATLSLVLLAGLFETSGVGAQETVRLRAGRLVRVTAPAYSPQRLEGRVVEWDGRALVVQGANGLRHRVASDQIRRLEVGVRRQRVKHRALIGAGVGALLGGLAHYERFEPQDSPPPFCISIFGSQCLTRSDADRKRKIQRRMFVGGLVGAAVGTAVGAFLGTVGAQGWEALPLSGPVVPSLYPSGDGATLTWNLPIG